MTLFFDTETSGIPDWKMPSESEHQPHLVTLAALLVNDQTQEAVESMDVIVRPDGWVIAPETIDIHGITQERAMDEGIPEIDALHMFMDMASRCDLRVAFNTTFDNRIIRIAQMRYYPQDDTHAELMRSWKEDKHLYFCAMINSRKVMGSKQPSLAEAYKFFTGNELQNAHNAMADTLACKEIYFHLMALKQAA